MTTATELPIEVIEEAERASSMLHPIRLEILSQLEREHDSATGIARRTGIPRQKLNYHLRQLEEEGFVELVEERKKRNCTERIFRATARSYLISPAALGDIGLSPAQIADQASSAYQLAVAAEMVRDVARLRSEASESGRRVPTLTLQTEVRFATPADQQAFAHELSEEVARLVSKYHNEERSNGRRFRLVAASYPATRKDVK